MVPAVYLNLKSSSFRKMLASKRKRESKTTKAQYEIYLNYLEKHRDFRLNKFKASDPLYLEKCWTELTNNLNSCGGPIRDTSSWKRKLCDWKSQVKKKARILKLENTKTGGGSNIAPLLNEQEERLVTLIGTITIEGANLPEGGICDNENVSDIQIVQFENVIVPEETEESNIYAASSSRSYNEEEEAEEEKEEKETKRIAVTKKSKIKKKKEGLAKTAAERAADKFCAAQSMEAESLCLVASELGGIKDALNRIADAIYTSKNY